MYPILAEFGPWRLLGREISIPINSYGLMLAAAFLICGQLYARELERRRLSAAIASTVVIWAVVGGIVGARLYYLIANWREVRSDIWSAVFSGSGLVAYGGFAGGIALTWLMLRRAGVPVLLATDAAAPLLALGYAIGRIGCFLAGDGDYGPPSALPWAMAFPRGIAPTQVPVHPTPMYETLIMLAVFAVLWRLRLRPWPIGRLFALYLALAGCERFVIEFWRINQRLALGLSGAQWIGAASVVLGLSWLAVLGPRRREGGRSPSPIA